MTHLQAWVLAGGGLCRRLPGGDGSGGVLHGDVLAEGRKAGDEALRLAVGVGAAVEVGRAEVRRACSISTRTIQKTRCPIFSV